MGYNTRYHLELEGDRCEIENLKNFVDKRDFNCLWMLLNYDEYEAKWYDHEFELKGFSANYPTLTFKLSGIGENWRDFWVKYFKNGKMKKYDCVLSHIPLFSEKELI